MKQRSFMIGTAKSLAAPRIGAAGDAGSQVRPQSGEPVLDQGLCHPRKGDFAHRLKSDALCADTRDLNTHAAPCKIAKRDNFYRPYLRRTSGLEVVVPSF
jgi:hypothetical protein